MLRGGITAAKKTAIVCEAYAVRCEIHMSGIGNLHVLGSTSEDTCEYYERGLLAPGVDYDVTPAYLTTPLDALEPDGYVSLPQRPGLGYEIEWEYIRENRIETLTPTPLPISGEGLFVPSPSIGRGGRFRAG